jgi:hypothetical protein
MEMKGRHCSETGKMPKIAKNCNNFNLQIIPFGDIISSCKYFTTPVAGFGSPVR